ncbi:MAG: hypothetical protein ACYDBJ_13080 [Aggregatilineales bacterium]
MRQFTLKPLAKGLTVVTVALTLLAAVAGVDVVQGQATPATQLGSAPGSTGFEFVGQIDQNGVALSGYGYLTHLNGLSDDQLFTTPGLTTSTEATARFTFTATGQLTGRYVLQNLITTDSTLLMTIYFNDKAGANFNHPDSFAGGVPIASLSVCFQHILDVTSPNTGAVVGSGDVTQTKVTPFTLNGQTYQLGSVGLIEHVSSFGSGKRTDPVAPKSQFIIAGNTQVIPAAAH